MNTQLKLLPRKAAAKVAAALLDEHKGHCSHIGMVALRQLLDAIYGGPPKTKDEWIVRKKGT